MSDTINSESPIGKRLLKIKKSKDLSLHFEGKTFPIICQITIGRDKKSAIRIDDSFVSKEHALIQKIKDAYFIKDLNSTNGTYLNEQLMEKDKYYKLKKFDKIRIGKTEIMIQ